MFKIDEYSKLIIYGYSDYSRKIKEKLESEGKKIVVFFDRDYEKFQKAGNNSVVDYRNFSGEKSVPVVILLQNIIEHNKVAKLLFDAGFPNIVFLASDNKFNNHMESRLRKTFRDLTYNNIFLCENIPSYGELEKASTIRLNNDKIIKQCKSYMIPDQYIYTSRDLYRKESSTEEEYIRQKVAIEKYIDQPLREMSCLLGFFHHLKGGEKNEENMRDYLNIFSIGTGKSLDEYMRDRKQLFELYNREYEQGLDFFIETSSLVKWNERGYFNIIDGTHRSAYLISKGLTEIPLCISTDDFQKYSGYISLHEVKDKK